MLLLSQSYFLHCENVRGGSAPTAGCCAWPHPGGAQHHPPLARAEGSWGDLAATFYVFKNMVFSGVFLKFLRETFSKNPHFFFLFVSIRTSASSQTAEPLSSWEDFFFQKEIFSPCLKVSVLILKLQLAGETFKTS